MIKDRESIQDTYARIMGQWVQQRHAYGQSVKLYHQLQKRWGGGRRRAAPSALPSLLGPEQCAAPGPAPRPRLQIVPDGALSTGGGQRRLTRRQLAVAELIAQGMTNDQIARRLVIANGTAANHVEHILKRLGLTNRAAVAAWFTGMHARSGATEQGAASDIAQVRKNLRGGS